ncbi:YbaN family protein [Bacteroidota bacterium]
MKSKQRSGHENQTNGVLKNRVLRLLLLASGWICVALGAIGVVLPLVPTTPFLLLAALCFYKSSPKFYTWLYANRFFGKYLLDYKEKKGVPIRVKIGTLLFMWASLAVSVYFVHILWLRILLLAMGAAVTIHLFAIRTKKS